MVTISNLINALVHASLMLLILLTLSTSEKSSLRNFLLCFVEKLEDLYAFSYNPLSEKLTRSAGWALFDIQSEYARMGLPNSEWCCSTLNKDYKVGNIFNI